MCPVYAHAMYWNVNVLHFLDCHKYENIYLYARTFKTVIFLSCSDCSQNMRDERFLGRQDIGILIL